MSVKRIPSSDHWQEHYQHGCEYRRCVRCDRSTHRIHPHFLFEDGEGGLIHQRCLTPEEVALIALQELDTRPEPWGGILDYDDHGRYTRER